MISDDKTLDKLEELVKEVRRFVLLQKEYALLDLVEKLTILLSTLLLIFILVVCILLGLFYLSFTAVYALTDWLGSLAASYAIIGCFFFVLSLLLYRYRKPLILNPVIKLLYHLFINDLKQ